MTLAPRILPTIMIVLSLGAAIGYALAPEADFRKAVYWASAAVLNLSVTW